MQEKQKVMYVNMDDICVACGNPTIPGDQICSACRKLAEGEPVSQGERSFLTVKKKRKGWIYRLFA